MYKKIFWSISAVVCTTLIAYIGIMPSNKSNDTAKGTKHQQRKISYDKINTPTDTDILQKNNDTSYADIESYSVQTLDNKLNIYQIYSNGYRELIQSVDINTSVLPEDDIIRLKEGITTDTYDKVCSMIEDFSS